MNHCMVLGDSPNLSGLCPHLGHMKEGFLFVFLIGQGIRDRCAGGHNMEGVVIWCS